MDLNNINNFLDEFISDNSNTYYWWNVFNNSKSYKVKDLTSPNLKFLSIDKNPRLLTNNKADINDIFSKLKKSSKKT